MENTLSRDSLVELHSMLLNAVRPVGPISFTGASVVPIVEKEFKSRVTDAPSKSIVVDSAGNRIGVVLLSSAANPDLVARSVRRACEAKKRVGDDLGSVIMEPLVAGDFRERSYAIWPAQRPVSNSRAFKYLQTRLLRPRLLRWLRAVTERTRVRAKKSHLDRAYCSPLQSMSADGRLSQELRVSARRALERIQSGEWQPYFVLTHNDLWLGNVLLPRLGTERGHNAHGFFIIDWAGAVIDGHPFFDLFRICMSTDSPMRVVLREIEAHRRILDCERDDVLSYLTAALGNIGENLEYFPVSRYLAMSEQVFCRASATLEGLR